MKALYNKIAEWLCSFSPDTYVHYIVMLIFTFLLAKLMIFVFTYTGCDYLVLLAEDLAILAGLIISLDMEKWDLKREDIFDNNDIKADILGTVSGYLMSIM